MSIFTSLSTKIFAGTIAFAGGMGGISAVASGSPTLQQEVKNVQSAIESKDLNAYKTAKTELIKEKSELELEEVNSTTQEELDQMATRQSQMKAVQEAVKNNDYEAFKASANEKMLQKINSQEEFDKLVTNYKTRQEFATKLAETIKNNDFEGFKALEQTRRNEVETTKGVDKPELSDEQLQARFDELVEAYKTDGSLPGQEDDFMMGGMKGGKMGRKGGMGR